MVVCLMAQEQTTQSDRKESHKLFINVGPRLKYNFKDTHMYSICVIDLITIIFLLFSHE